MTTAIDVVLAVLGIFLIYAVPIGVAIWILRMRAARAEKRRRKLIESTEWHWAYIEPDHDAFRAAYGVDMPPPLVRLYGDKDSASDVDFSLEDPKCPNEFYGGAVVYSFEPATAESVDFAVKMIGQGSFVFAGDGCGNYYYIRPGETRDGDAPVYFHDHEGDPCEKVDESLSAFLGRKRLRDGETPAERSPEASSMYRRVLADGRPFALPADGPMGPGFMFWALAPLLLIFIVSMPLLIPKMTAGAVIVMIILDALALSLILVLYDHKRFWWCGRAVGAIVFLCYAAYLTLELLESHGVVTIGDRRSAPLVLNAFVGLVVFGLPGLLYAVFGGLPWRRGKGKR